MVGAKNSFADRRLPLTQTGRVKKSGQKITRIFLMVQFQDHGSNAKAASAEAS